MPGTILQVLNEYGLDNTATLPNRLKAMSPRDWWNFGETLNERYPKSESPVVNNSGLNPLTFCFASLPANILSSISPHCLIADKVYIDDPLYDLADSLSVPAWSKELIDSWGYSENEVNGAALSTNLGRSATLSQMYENINFYLRAKELINENKLIPYKITTVSEPFIQYQKLFLQQIQNDSRLRKIAFGGGNKLLTEIDMLSRIIFGKLSGKKPEQIMKLLEQSDYSAKQFKHWSSIQPLFASLSQFALTDGLQGLSTDLVSPDYAYIFRRAIEVASLVNKELPPEKQLLLPAGFSLNGIQVPTLINIPIERVLDFIEQEPLAFESFRATLTEKLLGISAPPGSTERDKQILEIQEGIKRDIVDISTAYSGIKKTFSKTVAVHIALSTFSIFVAGFSTMGQNLGILALASSVFAGATLVSSTKDFAKELLDYQKELIQLKSKQNYFVWKLTASMYK